MRVRGHAVWIGSPTCVRAPVPQVRPGCALTLLSSSSAIGGNATGPCGGGELESQHTECYTDGPSFGLNLKDVFKPGEGRNNR